MVRRATGAPPGRPPGRYNRHKPLTAVCEFVQLEPDSSDGPFMYWDVAGHLFSDEKLTQPLDLQIVRVVSAPSPPRHLGPHRSQRQFLDEDADEDD